MRAAVCAAVILGATSASAQMAVTTFGATDAQACYEDARSERETSTDNCDAALAGQALTRRDRLATYVNRGVVNNRARRLTEALADFNAALDADPTLGEAWLNRGNARFLAGQYDLAVADYEKSLDASLSKPWVAWYNIGLAREAQKDARGARTAYERALACDPVSAFGGIVAVNRTLDAAAARKIVEIFTEVIIAPDADEEAIALIAAKKNLRLLLTGGLPDVRAGGLSLRTVSGGFLAQARDNAVVDDMALKVVTRRQPSEAELFDLRFAFRVAKHVKSNAIVYAKAGATVGIGAGQMSRVDSSRIAAWKAAEAAKAAGAPASLAKGSVVASDAFFPFADGLLAAAEAGATAVIQPGGSMRDDEVIRAADEAGLAMVFTGHRHFRH